MRTKWATIRQCRGLRARWPSDELLAFSLPSRVAVMRLLRYVRRHATRRAAVPSLADAEQRRADGSALRALRCSAPNPRSLAAEWTPPGQANRAVGGAEGGGNAWTRTAARRTGMRVA